MRRETFMRDLRGNLFHSVSISELPKEAIEAVRIMTFNRHLDNYKDTMGLEGYEPNVCKWG